MINIEYDPEADAMFIKLKDAEPAGSWKYEPGVLAIVDDEGAIIAIEILSVRRRFKLAQDYEALTASA